MCYDSWYVPAIIGINCFVSQITVKSVATIRPLPLPVAVQSMHTLSHDQIAGLQRGVGAVLWVGGGGEGW